MSKSTKIANDQNKTKIRSNQEFDQIPNIQGKILLDRYEVKELIKVQSGEANLYKAIDQKTNKPCIIKQYRRKNAIKSGIIEKLKNIIHPNISKILADGEYEGFTFVVLPNYKGITLEKYIQDGGRANLTDLKTTFIPILNELLHAIHEQGIIHKDLKPDNILITEPEKDLILIDFGISSEIDGKNIIVTQTGRTPFYSAPETSNGAFSIYSDYYSLGITIYELYTGEIPFQDKSQNKDDDLRYALMQKIPYPKDFPLELQNLIDGLTYKDLSHRDELNNPNRRWTYQEVNNWLKGIKQQVPGMIETKGDFVVPYLFRNKTKISTFAQLAESFLKNMDEAMKEVARGFLTRHFAQNGDQTRMKYAEEAEELLYSNLDKSLKPSSVIFKLLYQIMPQATTIYWQDHNFVNLSAYANALLDEALNSKNPDQDFLLTATDWIEKDVLLTYVEHHITDNLKASLVKLLENNKKLQKSLPLDPLNQALRLAYSITNREDFKIADLAFKNIDDFNNKLEDLYHHDLVQYIDLLNNHRTELIQHEKLLTAAQKKKFNQHILSKDRAIVLLEDQYYFRNRLEVLSFLCKLYEDHQLEWFYGFVSSAYNELTSNNKFKNADEAKYNKVLYYYKSLIKIDERVFKDQKELLSYAKTLHKYKSSLLEEFLYVHRDSLEEYANSSGSAGKFVDQLYQLTAVADGKGTFSPFANLIVAQDLKVGDFIKLGSYYQSGSEKREPIEWKVLAIEDHKALLLSKYALDCKPFNSNWVSTNWENSSIREWCNNFFFKFAFSIREQKQVVHSLIENNKQLNTMDYVFLLSIKEAQDYFANAKSRICTLTPYAKEQATWLNINEDRICSWWLRSLGQDASHAAFVSTEGIITDFGKYVDNGACCLRPALWINLED